MATLKKLSCLGIQCRNPLFFMEPRTAPAGAAGHGGPERMAHKLHEGHINCMWPYKLHVAILTVGAPSGLEASFFHKLLVAKLDLTDPDIFLDVLCDILVGLDSDHLDRFGWCPLSRGHLRLSGEIVVSGFRGLCVLHFVNLELLALHLIFGAACGVARLEEKRRIAG